MPPSPPHAYPAGPEKKVCPAATSWAISPSESVSRATNGPDSGAESAPMPVPTRAARRMAAAKASGSGHPATLVRRAQAYVAAPKGSACPSVNCPATPPITSHDAVKTASRNPVVNTSMKYALGDESGNRRSRPIPAASQPPRKGSAHGPEGSALHRLIPRFLALGGASPSTSVPPPGKGDDPRGARREKQGDGGEQSHVRPLGREEVRAGVAEDPGHHREEEDRHDRVHSGDDHDDEGQEGRGPPRGRRHAPRRGKQRPRR